MDSYPSARVIIQYRINITVHIQIQTKRIIGITVPPCILLCKSAESRTVVSCTEIIRTRLRIEILSRISERVCIRGACVAFLAKRIILVGLNHCTTAANLFYHIAVGVVNIELQKSTWFLKKLLTPKIYYAIILPPSNKCPVSGIRFDCFR